MPLPAGALGGAAAGGGLVRLGTALVAGGIAGDSRVLILHVTVLTGAGTQSED